MSEVWIVTEVWTPLDDSFTRLIVRRWPVALIASTYMIVKVNHNHTVPGPGTRVNVSITTHIEKVVWRSWVIRI